MASFRWGLNSNQALIISIVAGIVALLLLLVMGLGFWVSAVLGVIFGIVVWYFLQLGGEGEGGVEAGGGFSPPSDSPTARSVTPEPSAPPASPEQPGLAEAPATFEAEPQAASDAADTQLEDEVASARAEAFGSAESAPEPAAEEAVEVAEETAEAVEETVETASEGPAEAAAEEAAEAATEEAVEAPVAEETAPEPSAEAEAAPAEAPAAAAPTEPGAGVQPQGLEGPRDGGADDLKRIKGIGPALERLCNSLGFYHFDQIAAWSADEVAWVDQNLKGFKGRVTRDDWVEQAKLLASGAETEFSKRVDDGDVY